MSFIYAERLIEFAIRIGVDDLMKEENEEILNFLFEADPHTKKGTDLTPPGNPEEVKEPLLYDEFQKRLAEIPRREAETGIVGSIFQNSIPKLPDIKDFLTNPPKPVRIVHAFPREPEDLPAIVITLGNEDEGQQYLGTEKGEVQTTHGRYKIVGSDFDAQYNITVLTPNYDETILWYHIIRYSLLRWRTALVGYGLNKQRMTWLDPDLDPRYTDNYIYNRTCVLSCEKEEDFPVLIEQFSELSVGGVTVAGQGSQPDLTDGGQVSPDGSIIPDPDGGLPVPIHPLEFNE